MQYQGNFKICWLKEEINLLAAKFPPRRPLYCLLRFSCQHNARVILTLSEMYATVGSAIICDRLRLYGNNSLCDRLRSAICDPLSSAIIWKPAFNVGVRFHVRCLRQEYNSLTCIYSVKTAFFTVFWQLAEKIGCFHRRYIFSHLVL